MSPLLEKMRNYIRGGFLGVMIGDAMGMPVELMTSSEIARMGGVNSFINSYQKRIPDTENLKAGATTDDWALTKAMATTLTRRREFDICDIALAHVQAYEENKTGWGRTTKKSLEELKEYFDSRGVSGRSPHDSKVGGGKGNGVAMKILPLSAFKILNSGSQKPVFELIQSLGALTHSDARSWLAAYAVCTMGELILNNRLILEKYDVLVDDPIHEKKLDETLSDIISFEFDFNMTGILSSKLILMENVDFLYGDLQNIRDTFGTGLYCMESVPFAIALALRNLNDFRTGILEAVNSGGDTDTIASIVGGLIGFNVGMSGIPEEWVEFSPNFQEAIQVADEMCNVIGKDLK